MRNTTVFDIQDGFKLIDAAIKAASSLKLSVNIAVVDSGMNLLAFARMDNAWLGSIDVSIQKAKSAVMFDMDTNQLGQLSQVGQSLYGINTVVPVVLFGGGIPLYAQMDNENRVICVGAIGISGATVEQDTAIAQMAIDTAFGSAPPAEEVNPSAQEPTTDEPSVHDELRDKLDEVDELLDKPIELEQRIKGQ